MLYLCTLVIVPAVLVILSHGVLEQTIQTFIGIGLRKILANCFAIFTLQYKAPFLGTIKLSIICSANIISFQLQDYVKLH